MFYFNIHVIIIYSFEVIMHKIFKKYFELDDLDIDCVSKSQISAIYKIRPYGKIVYFSTTQRFYFKTFKHPQLDKYKQEAIEGYKFFADDYNKHFNPYNEETLRLLINPDDCSEELYFDFFDKNNISLIYLLTFEFKRGNGYIEKYKVRYSFKNYNKEPETITVEANMLRPKSSYYYDEKLCLDETINYFNNLGGNNLMLAYLSSKHYNAVIENFDSFEKFAEDFDNNYQVILMYLS